MRPLHTTLEQWRTFITIVDEGGFAQAAERLNRSQSAISYAVSRLQEQLGVALFEIQGRRALLSPAGTGLLNRARSLVDEAYQLEQFAHHLDGGWEAELGIAIDSAFPAELLMSALARFRPLSRGCRVRVSEVVLSGADELLEMGRADLAIAAHVPPNCLGDLLSDIEFTAVSVADHPLQQLGGELSPIELERETQIIIRDSASTGSGRSVGWQGAKQFWSVSSIDTAVAAVCEGLGFAWLPNHKIAQLVASGVLKSLPLQQGAHYRAPFYLIYGNNRTPGPAAQLLSQLLLEAVADK